MDVALAPARTRSRAWDFGVIAITTEFIADVRLALLYRR